MDCRSPSGSPPPSARTPNGSPPPAPATRDNLRRAFALLAEARIGLPANLASTLEPGQVYTLQSDNGPIDVSGGLPGVGELTGVDGLEAGLLSHPELFAGRLTEKLMVFALGRGLEYYDAPTVRAILRDAEANDYRFSSLVLGIVKSVPFQMKRNAER